MGIWRISFTYHTDVTPLQCLGPCFSFLFDPGDIIGSSDKVTALLNWCFTPADAASRNPLLPCGLFRIDTQAWS